MNQLRVSNLFNCFALSIGIGILLAGFSKSYGQTDFNQSFKSKTSDIIISEISDPLTNKGSRFIELYNPTDALVNLNSENYYLCRQANSGSVKSVLLNGTINPDETYLCIYDINSFSAEYGNIYDQQSTHWGMNGNDSFFLTKGGIYGVGATIDTYGQYGINGTGEGWEYADAHAVRKRSVSDPNSVWDPSEWVIISAGSDQMTPGRHMSDLNFNISSGSWNTNGNWSVMGYVPDVSDNITINSNQLVSIDASSACNQLIISQDSELSIEAGQDLCIIDTIINLAGNTGLILKSNSSGNSSLIHESDSISATVYSYFPDLNKWYLISAPVINATASVFYGQFLDYWDEPSESWVPIENENYLLKAGQGFSVKKTGTNLASYQGYLNNGEILIDSLRYSASNNPNLRGWNLIGNPFPSVLDFYQVDLSGKSINAGISVWPHNGTETSSYISWSQGGGSPVGDDEARYIQPGQAFMIQSASDMEFFYLDNSCRTHSGLGCMDKKIHGKSNQENTLVIELMGENMPSDKAYFAIRDNSSSNFDLDYDVRKMFGSAANPHVFSYSAQPDIEALAINCVPPTMAGDIYDLGLSIGIEGAYQLKISGKSTFNGKKIWLFDEISDQIYDLDQDTIIDFYWINGQTNKRFKLLFDEQVNINNSHLKTSELLIHARDSRLYFSGAGIMEGKTSVQIYNLLGQKVFEQVGISHNTGIKLSLSPGYYWAYIITGEKKLGQKIFWP